MNGAPEGKRTSGAEAPVSAFSYGTAKAVPLTRLGELAPVARLPRAALLIHYGGGGRYRVWVDIL